MDLAFRNPCAASCVGTKSRMSERIFRWIAFRLDFVRDAPTSTHSGRVKTDCKTLILVEYFNLALLNPS